jgi:hypothetical protein
MDNHNHNNYKGSGGGGSGGGGSRGGLPEGAVPVKNGVLSPHANEFWFPECRNCPCCKGFKHGCPCRAGSVNTCTHPDCENAEYSAKVATDLASRPAPVPIVTNNALTNPSETNSSPRSNSSISPRTPGGTCKFYASGNCRFGAACHYKHDNNGGSLPVPVSNAAIPCVYFSRGNCQYGDSCKNSHEM